MNEMCNVDLILQQLNVTKETVDSYYEERGAKSLSRTDYENTVKVEERLEEIALMIRDKVNENYFFSSNQPAPITDNIVDFTVRKTLLNSLKVNKTGSVVKIEMPPLLHRKVYCKRKKDDEYYEKYYTNRLIDDDLYSVLRSYKSKNNIPKYSEKVLIYIENIVCGKGRIANIPDTDNHEYHDLINTVSCVFLADDSPEQAAFMFNTNLGSENKTRVFLIPFSEVFGPLSKAIQMDLPREHDRVTVCGEIKDNVIRFPSVA